MTLRGVRAIFVVELGGLADVFIVERRPRIAAVEWNLSFVCRRAVQVTFGMLIQKEGRVYLEPISQGYILGGSLSQTSGQGATCVFCIYMWYDSNSEQPHVQSRGYEGHEKLGWLPARMPFYADNYDSVQPDV
jgi:hypothetical protein